MKNTSHLILLALAIMVTACLVPAESPPPLPSTSAPTIGEARSAIVAAEWCVGIQRGNPTPWTTVADGSVRSDQTNTNSGSSSGWSVAVTAGPVYRQSYAAFDLSSIPSGSTVNSAVLSAWVNLRQGSPAPLVHAVSATWAENTLTWANKPAFGSAFPGTWPTASSGLVSFSIPAATVQGWVTTPSSNYGLAVETDASAPVASEAMSSSEDNSFGGIGHHPRLTVCFTPPANCDNGIQDGSETGIDCGGSCRACATCVDGIQNQGEIGVDCGGPCGACDGGLPPGFSNPTLSNGVWQWTAAATQGGTTYQGGSTSVFVVAPPQCDGTNRCKVLVMLPVSAGDDRGGVDQIVAEGIAARYHLIVVGPTFTTDPWGTDCGTNHLQDRWIPEVVIPFVDANYPTTGAAGDRGILGWSKGGFFAVNQLLRHPSTYNRAGSWDGPLAMVNRTETLCSDADFNAGWRIPKPYSLSTRGGTFVSPAPARFVIDGWSSTSLQSDGNAVAADMLSLNIGRKLDNSFLRTHAVTSGWLDRMVAWLFATSLPTP